MQPLNSDNLYLPTWKAQQGYYHSNGIFFDDQLCDYYEDEHRALLASRHYPPPHAHLAWARDFDLKTVPGRPWETVGEWVVEPIVELAERAGLRPRKRGKEYVVLCPAHQDKHASCYLNSEKNAWHCFACGEGGGSKKFKQLIGL